MSYKHKINKQINTRFHFVFKLNDEKYMPVISIFLFNIHIHICYNVICIYVRCVFVSVCLYVSYVSQQNIIIIVISILCYKNKIYVYMREKQSLQN